MAIDIPTFRTRFPELKDPPYNDVKVQLALDDSGLCVDETKWGKFYELGVYYLAAHELVLGQQNAIAPGKGGGAGPIQAKTVDKVNYTRAVNGMEVDDGHTRLASTSYGLKYLELLAKVRPVGFMVIC